MEESSVKGSAPHTAKCRSQPVVQSTWYSLPCMPRFATALAPPTSWHVMTEEGAEVFADEGVLAFAWGVAVASEVAFPPAPVAAAAGGALTAKLPDAGPYAEVLRRALLPAA